MVRWDRVDQYARGVATQADHLTRPDTSLETVLLAQTRRDRLDKAIVAMAAEPGWAPMVGRLQCLRGVSTLTAFGLAVEVGDWHRFTGNTIELVKFSV